MPRPPRLQAPDAIYHVTSRGTEGRPVFLDDRDRRRFLGVLAETVQDCAWRCFAYCLMTNHFHLLVQTPNPDLAIGMHRVNSAHANYFNRRHDHVGHLFQARYGAELVVHEAHLLESCRYIVLNPVRAGICRRVSSWRWSSYRATAGYVSAPGFLATDWVLRQFGNSRQRAPLRYIEFVAAGVRDVAAADVSRGLAPGHVRKGRGRTSYPARTGSQRRLAPTRRAARPR
jgi:putative transposase